MFNWVDSTKPVVVKLPTEIYWISSGAMTSIFIAGIFLMTNPLEFFKTMLEKSWVYARCKKAAKGDEESNGRTNSQTNGEMNGQTNGEMNGQTNEEMNEHKTFQ